VSDTFAVSFRIPNPCYADLGSTMLKLDISSSLGRWMCFVDGENLTFRAQALAKKRQRRLPPGPYYEPDTFFWFRGLRTIDVILRAFETGSYDLPLRSYYYTTARGDDSRLQEIRQNLRAIGFDPQVFKRAGEEPNKSKGLDITLAKDILGHGFRTNYNVLFLFAGDGDYVPLVEEMKRIGKIVVVGFFEESGLSPALRLAADRFFPLDSLLEEQS